MNEGSTSENGKNAKENARFSSFKETATKKEKIMKATEKSETSRFTAKELRTKLCDMTDADLDSSLRAIVREEGSPSVRSWANDHEAWNMTLHEAISYLVESINVVNE